MALDPISMTAAMLARSPPLQNAPPNFALFRVYSAMAIGIVETLLDPSATIVTLSYGPGQPAVTFGVAGPSLGLDGLDPDRYSPLAQASAGYFGPFSTPFFTGIGGVVETLAQATTVTDLFGPTGNGIALLPGGGIVMDADACFDNMKVAAQADNMMVVVLGVHVTDPLQSIPDPITQEPLFVGDLFTRAEILLRGVATSLAVELLIATKAGIPVVGAFVPIVPPISGATITAVLS